MTKEILDLFIHPEVQEYIRLHESDDVQKLLLKRQTVRGVPPVQIVQQIIGRKKSLHKLPLWHNKDGIVYPPSLNLEQCSSEVTANFKLSLLKKLCKEPPVVTDLTGGFGIDTYFLSQHARQVHYIEPDLELLEIARHNHQLLGTSNITYHNISAETFLSSTNEIPDFLFTDPSRRKGAKKVFKLTDCEPDVTALQAKYFRKAKHILIKTSPLLDIKQACLQLENVKAVHVVSIENECRELLFHLQPGFAGEPIIHTLDLNKHDKIANECSFSFEEEKKSIAKFSKPLSFLFEPNAAILKAGGFKWIAEHYSLLKLAHNTHLYTANQIVENFPGRIFKIVNEAKLDKSLLKIFKKGYANILTRNYPLSVEAIKKKTGLKEGGEFYLICTQAEKLKFVMVAERIK